MIIARAPGKLILSGEHAVVYGCPALVMAVNQMVTATITTCPEAELHVQAPTIVGESRQPIAKLRELAAQLDARHAAFMAGNRPIQSILNESMELVQYAVARVLSMFPEALPAHGLHIELTSDLPVGCGMGSSAALAAAVIAGSAIAWNQPVSPETVYDWTWATERLQHGRPSGVDPYITVHGGIVQFLSGTAEKVPAPDFPVHMALTGTPAATTGESVDWVRTHHANNPALWESFRQVTTDMTHALVATNWKIVATHIRANHRLLCSLGVVPMRVQSFITDLETAGFSAKVCGAGSSAGDAAGIVWIIGDGDPTPVIEAHGYAAQRLARAPSGVQVHVDSQ